MFGRSQDPWSVPPTPRGNPPRTHGTTHDVPPPDGAALMDQVKYWYGEQTRAWWAFVPAAGGYPEQLLESQSQDALRADVARLCRALGGVR